MTTADINKILAAVKNGHAMTGSVPSVEELAGSTGLDTSDVMAGLNRLKKQGLVSEYNDRYYLRGESPVTTTEETPTPRTYDIGTTIIRAVMLLVSVVAVGISIYFSRLWLQSFLSDFRALSLAVVMVLYATVAPQIAGVILRRVTVGTVAYTVVIATTALVVMAFSMVSTVAGQYAGFRQSETQTGTSRQWQLLVRQEADTRERIADKQEEIDAVQVLLKEFDTLEKRTENWTFYLTTTADLERFGDDMDALQSRLQGIQEEQTAMLATTEVTDLDRGTETFYSWLSALLGIAADRVQFWLSMFPAVFVDVIAPLALAIAIFLRKSE